MKKTLLVACALLCANMVMAQVPPAKEFNWFGSDKEYGNSEEAEKETGIRRTKSEPIAPATLLLLGLGGAVVGTKVVRNKRK